MVRFVLAYLAVPLSELSILPLLAKSHGDRLVVGAVASGNQNANAFPARETTIHQQFVATQQIDVKHRFVLLVARLGVRRSRSRRRRRGRWTCSKVFSGSDGAHSLNVCRVEIERWHGSRSYSSRTSQSCKSLLRATTPTIATSYRNHEAMGVRSSATGGCAEVQRRNLCIKSAARMALTCPVASLPLAPHLGSPSILRITPRNVLEAQALHGGDVFLVHFALRHNMLAHGFAFIPSVAEVANDRRASFSQRLPHQR